MRRRGLRESSIKHRLSVTRSWLRWCDIEGVDPMSGATRQDVERWLDTHRCAARARATLISHLHMFYVWCQREELTSSDPTVLVERPRLPRRLPRPARNDLVGVAILSAPPVMARILSLMADAGLRCCEVAALSWHDVDLVEGRLFVTGKGGHDRVVGIPRRLLAILSAADDTEGAVTGRRMSACLVSQNVSEYLRGAGVGATAHQLRHLYATRLYTAVGGNILKVQQALGHQSVTSTQIYTHIDAGAAIEAARLLDEGA